MEKRQKGISPLVATVLLVSITMAAAIIIASWANIFLGQKKTEFEEFSQTERECRFGNMKFLEELKYDSTNKKLTAIVENTGRVSLDGFKFQLIYTDNSVGNATVSTETIAPGNFLIVSTTVTPPASQGIKFARLTTECQDVYLEKSFA